jgi:DNA-binding GntR family transcriptional regulator
VVRQIKYYEIKLHLEEMIRRGEIAVGAKLPAEPELMQRYQVSRGTLRQALKELEQDGLISRHSGQGTTVVRKPGATEAKEGKVVSLTKQIEAAGLRPSTRVLDQRRMMASEAGEWVCQALGLSPKLAAAKPVYTIDRLRCGDDRPLARQTLYLLAEQFAPDLESEDFTRSVFDLYRRYNRYVAWADEEICARLAGPDEVKLFEMRSSAPLRRLVYVRKRVSYDQYNRVLEVMHSIDRGDFFQRYHYRILEEYSQQGAGEGKP